MVQDRYLVAKAERTLARREKDNDARVAAMTGTGIIVGQKVGNAVLGEAAGTLVRRGKGQLVRVIRRAK